MHTWLHATADQGKLPCGPLPVQAYGAGVPAPHVQRGCCAEQERRAAVFECRKAVARRQAEEACGRLAEQPPEPAFAQATLNVAGIVRGDFTGPGVFVRHDGSAGTPRATPPSVSVAVEPTADVVSNELLARGAGFAAAMASPVRVRSSPPLLRCARDRRSRLDEGM